MQDSRIEKEKVGESKFFRGQFGGGGSSGPRSGLLSVIRGREAVEGCRKDEWRELRVERQSGTGTQRDRAETVCVCDCRREGGMGGLVLVVGWAGRAARGRLVWEEGIRIGAVRWLQPLVVRPRVGCALFWGRSQASSEQTLQYPAHTGKY